MVSVFRYGMFDDFAQEEGITEVQENALPLSLIFDSVTCEPFIGQTVGSSCRIVGEKSAFVIEESAGRLVDDFPKVNSVISLPDLASFSIG